MFLYISILNGEIQTCHNFRLNGQNDFTLTPQHNINKLNISWNFNENPTR